MASTGTVRFWNRDEGWGVIDCEETPGGCWANFTVVWNDKTPKAGPGEMVVSEFIELLEGEAVAFSWQEVPGTQYGYDFIATSVSPRREPANFAVKPKESP